MFKEIKVLRSLRENVKLKWKKLKSHSTDLTEIQLPKLTIENKMEIKSRYVPLKARYTHTHRPYLSQTIADCIRYIIDVFCYNFRSHTNIINTLHIYTLACAKGEI